MKSEIETAQRTVLVVDDSRMQRRLVCNALLKWGYSVLEAECGEDGLSLCKKHDIAMVISDWMMPGMSGPELCRAYRSLTSGGYGFFLLLTSKNGAAEIAEGLNSGANDFLSKPVGFGELRARLSAGERVLSMQEKLVETNKKVVTAFKKLQSMYAQIDKDLEDARNLQLSLVPKNDLRFPQGHISMLLRPCGHVGGDLVGSFRISDSQIGMFSLDVSGHGISSALMTARLAGCLNGVSQAQNVAMRDLGDGHFEAIDPAQTATNLNELLFGELETEHYLTLALAVVNTKTGHVSCVQAGHPHPIVFSRDGKISKKGDGGLPIGLIEGAEFQSFDFQLNPGDSLMLYSDGITESTKEDGSLFDEDGLFGWLNEAAGRNSHHILSGLVSHLEQLRGTKELEDDLSAIVLQYDGVPQQRSPDEADNSIAA